MEWNILATAKSFMEKRLLKQLQPFGRFRPTGFRDVLFGLVPDRDAFLENMELEYEKFPFNLSAVSKVVPVEVTFDFIVEDFLEKAKEAVRPYAERIGDGKFYVRIERRGHKGELDSHVLEQTIGEYLHREAVALGHHPGTDFKDPDMIVVVETFGNHAGTGLITREMRKKCRFLTVR